MKRKYTNDVQCVQPLGTKIEATVDRQLFMPLKIKLKTGTQNGGNYMQMVALRRKMLVQV